MTPENVARLLGELLGQALNDALSPFGRPPRGPMHCACGPTGHACALRATLRWGGRGQHMWTHAGWVQLAEPEPWPAQQLGYGSSGDDWCECDDCEGDR